MIALGLKASNLQYGKMLVRSCCISSSSNSGSGGSSSDGSRVNVGSCNSGSGGSSRSDGTRVKGE